MTDDKATGLLPDLPIEPPMGHFLAHLVERGEATPVYNVAGPARVTRTEFLTTFPADPAAARFASRMSDPEFRSYVSTALRVHRLQGVSVAGTDAVLLHGQAVIRDSLRHIMYWAEDLLIADFRQSEHVRFRRPIPVHDLPADSLYFVGFTGAWRNYAHWMQETLPKLVVFAERFLSGSRIRLVLPELPRRSFQAQTLALLGIPPEVVLTIPGGEALHLPDALLMDDADLWNVPPFVHQAAQRLAARVPPGLAVSPSRRVYIHRRVGLRQLANFDELWPAIAARGYLLFVPEEHSLAVQIATMREAQCVVSEHGAGLANVLFCRPDGRVIEMFNPACVQPAFWSVASVCGLGFGYTVGEHVPTAERPEPDWNSSYRLTPQQISDVLDAVE